MFEAFISFCLGWLVRSFISAPTTYETILAWDNETFGWRPVPPGSRLDPSKKYIAAIEVDVAKHVETA